MSRGRFLFITWSGGGNIQPLAALGAKLLARGHDVRVLGPADLAPRFEADGLAFRATCDLGEWGAEDASAEARRVPTDVLVVDYMQPAALCAAEQAGLPVVAFVHTLYADVAAGPRSPMHMAATVDGVNALRAELGLEPVARLPDLLDRASRVLVTTVPELDRPDGPLPPNVQYVGPILEEPGPHAGWAAPWPSSDTPLVVVSLGTTPMDEGPLLQRALDAMADLPVHVWATVGTHLDPASFTVPANAVVSRYVRHAAVLPHADLFVGHGGLSGIGAALSFSLPLICIPLGREQPDNASRVEAAGAGRTLVPDVSVDELRAAVARMLTDEGCHAAARSFASTIAGYGNGARAVAELEALLST